MAMRCYNKQEELRTLSLNTQAIRHFLVSAPIKKSPLPAYSHPNLGDSTHSKSFLVQNVKVWQFGGLCESIDFYSDSGKRLVFFVLNEKCS